MKCKSMSSDARAGRLAEALVESPSIAGMACTKQVMDVVRAGAFMTKTCGAHCKRLEGGEGLAMKGRAAAVS